MIKYTYSKIWQYLIILYIDYLIPVLKRDFTIEKYYEKIKAWGRR